MRIAQCQLAQPGSVVKFKPAAGRESRISRSLGRICPKVLRLRRRRDQRPEVAEFASLLYAAKSKAAPWWRAI